MPERVVIAYILIALMLFALCFAIYRYRKAKREAHERRYRNR